ncbi:hypothetical protein SNE40_020516 [Patella caerulea]|uniref:Uncharacterized protein n=1 Tax=Patella caerulea TaxID=87958 RepID=A0AAN8GE84_PATCE
MKTWTLRGILFMDVIITQVLTDRIVNEAIKHEALLYKDLFSDYGSGLVPRGNETGSVTIGMGIEFNSNIDMDEIKEQLGVTVVFVKEWTDERLMWDPNRYGGISILKMPASIVWLPDIVLFNGVGEEFTFNKDKVILYNSGKVYWMHSVRLLIKCNVDLIKFPFDKQVCKFSFGSWGYNGNIVNITYFRGDASKSIYVVGPSGNDWKITDHSVRLLETYYSCCPEPYQTMEYRVTLERKPLYYIHVYILPAVILSLLIPFQLFLPPESRERLTLGVFYTFNLIWSCFATLATIFALNVHNRGPRQGKMPDIIRWVFLRCLKRIVCLGNDTDNPGEACNASGSMKGLENPMLSSSTDGQKVKETETGSKLEADVEDLNRQIRFFTRRVRSNEVKEEMLGEWHQVSLVIDRIIFFLFLLSVAVYSAVLL